MENRIRIHNHESITENKPAKTKMTKSQAGRQGGLAKHKCRGRGCKTRNTALTNLFS